MTYHEGELAVQERAGVRGMAARVGQSVFPHLNQILQRFIAEQDLLVVASLDRQGCPWTSVITGTPGFAQALNPETLEVRVPLDPRDPLRANLQVGARLGLLAIDLATRQRVRVNGEVAWKSSGGFALSIEEAYGNCQKYIQKRDPELLPVNTVSAEPSARTNLSNAQRTMIERADTFFIATAHPYTGADASHRGGASGFVRVRDDHQLEFPDYQGNAMFNTLGNIEATGRAGLLFLDFERDRALHLTGSARIVWDPARVAAHRGAERLVEFTAEQVLERPALTGKRWTLREPSPFNPI